jgi:type III pantothenate kinase
VSLRDQVVWLSNVAGEEIAAMMSQLLQEQSCVSYQFATTHARQCGVRNGYRQPQQLGVDRWLAMLAAFHLPQRAACQSLCVVDCGTALTMDVLDANGQHLGGYIAPGLTTMQEMLNQKLADIDIEPVDHGSVRVPADNTADGVARGCAQVLLGGVRQMLEDSLPANEKSCIVLTGGGAQWVQDGLKLTAEAVCEPWLVNKGLRLVAAD